MPPPIQPPTMRATAPVSEPMPAIQAPARAPQFQPLESAIEPRSQLDPYSDFADPFHRPAAQPESHRVTPHSPVTSQSIFADSASSLRYQSASDSRISHLFNQLKRNTDHAQTLEKFRLLTGLDFKPEHITQLRRSLKVRMSSSPSERFSMAFKAIEQQLAPTYSPARTVRPGDPAPMTDMEQLYNHIMTRH
jgi:hypothetical protein